MSKPSQTYLALSDSELSSEPERLIKADLLDCRLSSDNQWQMRLSLKSSPEAQVLNLSVPDYFKATAIVARGILQHFQSFGLPPPQVNLFNVCRVQESLAFLRLPSSPTDLCPLLVLQPAYLLNVTALTHFDYCPRNYLISRYTLPQTQEAMLRGSLVHGLFGFMLQNINAPDRFPERACFELDQQLLDLTLNDIDVHEYYQAARDHLNILAACTRNLLKPADWKGCYPERYLINPEIGIKGKIDALIQQSDATWQALELKTGKSWGKEANAGHVFQIYAYYLLLSQIGIGPLEPPTVIYTGNQARQIQQNLPLLPLSTMLKKLPFDPQLIVKIVNLRNQLVYADYTGKITFTENERKCKACVTFGKADICAKLDKLGLAGGSQNPEPLNPIYAAAAISPEIQKAFQTMHDALKAEFLDIRLRHGELLQSSLSKRLQEGLALQVKLELSSVPGTVALSFPQGNQSEFREGDPCLLSDAAGPTQGNCVEGYLSAIDKTSAVVSLPQTVDQLWFRPAYLDLNMPDAAFEKNFAGLTALWLEQHNHDDVLKPVRNFLLGKPDAFRLNIAEPAEIPPVNPPPSDAQLQAVRLASGLKDILLIHGPPGTGKTYTLALIIKMLIKAGKTVALATYTHRAMDEIFSKLQVTAPEIAVWKLGRPESTARQHRDKCLENNLPKNFNSQPPNRAEMLALLKARQEESRAIIQRPAVYAATTHAWLSGKYDTLPALITKKKQAVFDVMVVDEASQIITPNLAGSLRLAKSWILAGDHKQLPPTITSAAGKILRKTLFEQMAESLQNNPDLIVQLTDQYRMPPNLSNFISHNFYHGKLKTAVIRQSRFISAKPPDFLTADKSDMVLVDIKPETGRPQAKQFHREALWIADAVASFNNQSSWLESGSKPSVGIVAPYRAQVACLRAALEERFNKNFQADLNDLADTIDRFQGDERDIMILSLCLQKGEGGIPRVYQDERRINVALSRAKSKLVIAGCLAAMDSIPIFKALKNYVSRG